MNAKILLIGGTGALAAYLVPELLEKGCRLDVITLDDAVSKNPALRYIRMNAKDLNALEAVVKAGRYDAIVDFMIYPVPTLYAPFKALFLANTTHYVFMSTYRVYADSWPITEESPRLLDVSRDEAMLTSNDYAIYKAQEEDMLRADRRRNWTILRPAITYSKRRFQLVTLEAPVLVYRMLRGQTVVVPEQAMDVQGTLSWSGDYGRMVSRLILNEKAMGETYTVSTAEHHTWREIAEIYREIGGLKYLPVDMEDYLNIIGPGNVNVRQQLTLDRLFNRVVDNSKILAATGCTQADMMPLRQGLARELGALRPDDIPGNAAVNARMDDYLKKL